LSVLTEERLIQFMRETIELERDCLDRIIQEGTRPAPEQVLKRFRHLVGSLEAEKDNEASLHEECWNWIWNVNEGMNLIQLYGRLAWINLQLLELL